MPYCNRVCISSHFRDNGPQRYWGHELDLSRPRDVIDHVTNRFAICHFLLLSHWNWDSIFNRFRDIRPQVPCAHTRRYTDTQTHAASDFYSVPCSILHWTDKNQKKLAPKSTLRTQTTYVVPIKLQASQTTPLGYACIRRQTTRLRYKSVASTIEEQ